MLKCREGIFSRTFYKGIFSVAVCIFAAGYASVLSAAEQPAGIFPSVKAKQFVITGISTGDIPVFHDVFVFNGDGSFVMKKMENYGEGEYFEYGSGCFYFLFINREGVDIQFSEGSGFSLPGVPGQLITGVGSLMVDYEIMPMIFYGVEVFRQ